MRKFSTRNEQRAIRKSAALLAALCVIFAVLVVVGIIALANKGGADPVINVHAEPTPNITAAFNPSTPTAVPTPTEEPTPTPACIDPARPIIAFTFDDGPAAHATVKILDVCEQYNIRATFFIVGDLAKNHPEIIERAYSLGCQIGNHTQTHTLKLKGATAEAIRAELSPVDELVTTLTGERPPYVRPPWGSFDETALDVINRPVILWSVDTEDWKTKDKDAVCTEIRSSVFDGAIILMHDLYVTSADAFAEMVPELIDQGYQIVTVNEMFTARGITLEPGHAYRSAKPSPTATPAVTPTVTP